MKIYWYDVINDYVFEDEYSYLVLSDSGKFLFCHTYSKRMKLICEVK